VSPRHTRQEIIDAFDEISLLISEGECYGSKSVLTNPKDRIYAELSWLPGVSPRRAKELIANRNQILNDYFDLNYLQFDKLIGELTQNKHNYNK
jgi:hypothetical protein